MYLPKSRISESAHIPSMEAYEQEYRRSLEDPDGFWAEQGAKLSWFQDPSATRSGGYELSLIHI